MDFLKEALGEELYAQVADKLNGNDKIKLANLANGEYIPKAKYDAERTTSKGLKTQIEELNTKIAEMQNVSNGADALKAQLAQIQADLAKKDAEIKSQRLDFSILESARTHKAKDPALMAKMVDRSKIAEKDDGYIGLDEQFDELAKSYSYMFETAPAQAGGFDANRVPNLSSGTNENAVMNAMIRGTLGR